MSVVIPNKSILVNLAVSVQSLLQFYQERYNHQDKHNIKSFLTNELNIKVNVEDTLACICVKANRLCLGSRKNCSSPGEQISEIGSLMWFF